MKMVHVQTTPDNGYLIVDATGAPAGGVSFAPTSAARSQQELRGALKSFGFTEKAIDNAIAELNETGNTALQL
jgi:hypothetical protein